jgi:hypothetical protein
MQITPDDISYIKASKRWKFDLQYFRNRAWMTLRLLVIVCIAGFLFYQQLKWAYHMNSFLYFLLIYSIIMTLFDQPRFKQMELPPGVSFDDIKQHASDLNWELLQEFDELLQFRTASSFWRNQETVTILKVDEQQILINSQNGGFRREKINFNKLVRS